MHEFLTINLINKPQTININYKSQNMIRVKTKIKIRWTII